MNSVDEDVAKLFNMYKPRDIFTAMSNYFWAKGVKVHCDNSPVRVALAQQYKDHAILLNDYVTKTKYPGE